jgi:hypothetical protein
VRTIVRRVEDLEEGERGHGEEEDRKVVAVKDDAAGQVRSGTRRCERRRVQEQNGGVG